MPSSIVLSDNGASSGSAGIKTQGGNDGVLILQTTTSGGTATNAVYVDNSQNVALGATPSAWAIKALQVESASISNSGNGQYQSANAFFNAGSWKYIGNGYAAQHYLNASGGEHVLRSTTSGSASGTITWTNVLSVNKGTTLVLENGSSSSGTGIAFPATQSASSDANTLDDYEEGTFTPTVLGFSTPGTGTYNGRLGRYTRVGNRVYIQMWVDWSNLSGASGALGFGGLPFTSPNTAYVYNALICYMDGAVTLNANNVIQCYIPVNDSRVLLTQYVTGGGNAATVTLDSAGAVMICGWYEPA